MEDKKNFWEALKHILLGVLSAVLVILGIKKRRSDNQVDDNDEVVEIINYNINNLSYTTDEIDKQVEEANKLIEESNCLVKKIKSHECDAAEVVKSNKEILEKYKDKI